MSDFDLSDWRRDLEASMRAGDWLHVGLLLDRLEGEWDDLAEAAALWPDTEDDGAKPAAEASPG